MVFRQILHHWLGSQAREAIHREVRTAAAEQLARARQTAESAGSTDPHCDVGIVFALEIEAGGLVDLLEQPLALRGQGFKTRLGTLRSRRVALVTSGAGLARAEHATKALLDTHRPRWVVSAGFAGGLTPGLSRHDVLLANALVRCGGEPLPFDSPIDLATLAAGAHVGPLMTVDKIVHRPDEKRRLGQQSGALAVDTETAAVAEVCRQRNVPILAVRIITDGVDEQLPADVQHLTDQPSLAGQLGAALGSVWRRPKSVKDLWALKETALVASDRLAKYLTVLVEKLTPV